jgi:hypothetical protein
MKKILFISALAALTVVANAQSYSTSFEAPTYTTTALGVDGWTAGSGTMTHTISTAQAASGSQSVFVTGTTTDFTSLRQNLGSALTLGYIASVKVWLDLTNSATNVAGTGPNTRLFGLYASTSTLGGTTLGVTVGVDGGIRLGTSWGATFATTPNSTMTDFVGKWLTLSIVKNNNGTGSATVSGFGANNAGSFSLNFATVGNVQYFHFGTDYVASSTGKAYFDDFQYAMTPVPEPASMAALGLGALALIRKRRNSK